MDATALSQELISLHEHPREVPPFGERFPGITPAVGYAAARKLHEHRVEQGWRPRGRKIGFTNRTLWERYGVREPMWGTVYDRTLIMAIHERARISLQGLVQPRIEPEICFKLKSDIKEKLEPTALLQCIESVAHSVEIVQCHHPDWKVTIADCCADNGLHGRLVVSTFVRIDDLSDLVARLPATEARLFRENALVDTGTGANVLGSPLAALGFLVEALESQPDAPPLAAGEIVTTGTLTDAHPVKPGETWSTSLSGVPLPGLTVQFA